MTYTLSEIAAMLGVAAPDAPERHISVLLTDSRSLTNPSETLFFALRTPQNDGHRFVEGLYKSGVRAFVVDKELNGDILSKMSDAVIFTVGNTLDSLQKLASMHRRRFKKPVVGITGSRGKTIVKEWLGYVMMPQLNVVRSPRSFNSQIGVPLSLWNLDNECQVAVFEAGISKFGEMGTLQEIICPQIGIFTNIGDEHDAGFDSIEQKCREKMLLFKECEDLVYCADNTLISGIAVDSVEKGVIKSWTINGNSSAWLQLSVEHLQPGETTIRYEYEGVCRSVTIKYTRKEDIENACHVLAASLVLGIEHDIIARRMSTLPQIDTRLSVIEGVNSCMIITDVGPVADSVWMSTSLDFMCRRKTPDVTLTVILVNPEIVIDSNLKKILVRRGVSRLIITGDRPSEPVCGDGFPELKVEQYVSLQQMLAEVSQSDFDHELILIESSDSLCAESVLEMLEARRHETVLEVNLDALVGNFNLMRSLVKPTTGVVAMVKAGGYGAGSYELAKTLQAQGASYLAVAVADEGVELRNRGITMPIMVLNPKVTNYRTLFRYGLEPEIYSFDILDQIICQAERQGMNGFPIHIKIDSGMHRLGFLLEDMPRLVSTLQKHKAVSPCSVFSHLAAADCPDMDSYTALQFDYFDSCCKQLQAGFGHHIMRHILNSVGIARFPDHQFDMVRLGICLYGISPLELPQLAGLKPVSTLRTVIISIKTWNDGTTIGYGRRGVVTKESRIATLPIGYADGLNRHLGCGRGAVFINGCRCPIVGSICMDVCMVDVTGCECEVGDAVEIFGRNITADEVAGLLDTIPYEVLTSVSQRVKRVYYRE